MDIPFFRRGVRLPRPPQPAGVSRAPLPERVKLLLAQGNEPPAKPVVEAGESVKVGQLVAEAPPEGGAALHSPVQGRVARFEELRSPDGSEKRAIVIEVEGEGEWAVLEPDSRPLSKKPEELIQRIRDAGIFLPGPEALSLATVLREARAPRGFLTPVGQVVQRPVEHLAVRFVDAEPALRALETYSAGLGTEELDELVRGIELLLHVVGAEHVHLVLDRRQSLPAVEELAEQRDWDLKRVDARLYPYTSDPLLVRAVSGREPDVAFRRVHESGTLVLDVDTVIDVSRAVYGGRPQLMRLLTVSGPAGTSVYRVPIGMTFRELAEVAGQRGDWGKVVLGGPMRGLAHFTLDYPVALEHRGLTLYERGDFARWDNQPCANCGLCVRACPMRLDPALLARYCEYQRWDEAEAAHIFSCIECGACAYACPAGRSLVQYMVLGKKEILALRRAG